MTSDSSVSFRRRRRLPAPCRTRTVATRTPPTRASAPPSTTGAVATLQSPQQLLLPLPRRTPSRAQGLQLPPPPPRATGDEDGGDAMEDDAGAVAAAPMHARPGIPSDRHQEIQEDQRGPSSHLTRSKRFATLLGWGTPLPSCLPTRLAPSSLMSAPKTSLASSSRAPAGPPMTTRSVPCAPTSDR